MAAAAAAAAPPDAARGRSRQLDPRCIRFDVSAALKRALIRDPARKSRPPWRMHFGKLS
jgi:hypothetical protein